ncbi:MAG: PEP-CTERM sorting domain-containing protein [Planctomycetota bacterium]
MFPAHRLLLSVTVGTGCLVAANAAAAPIEYIGSSGNWNTSANWSAGTIPDAVDADPFLDHDPLNDGAVTINVDGDFDLRSFTVNFAGSAANNAPVILGDPGGASSLTFTDGGTVRFDTSFNRNGTNLQLAIDVNFQTLNLESGNRNSGTGQTARGIVLADGTFAGDTLNANGTVTFDGSATYDIGTFVGTGNVTTEFLGSSVDLSETAFLLSYNGTGPTAAKRSFIGADTTLGSLTIDEVGVGAIAPGVYTALNADTVPLAGGGTVNLNDFFVFDGSASLTVVPEPGTMAFASLGLLVALRRIR